jgi:hypothetical protein
MRLTGVASSPASPIGERAKILGISPERRTKATRAALPLIADGALLISVGVAARLFAYSIPSRRVLLPSLWARRVLDANDGIFGPRGEGSGNSRRRMFVWAHPLNPRFAGPSEVIEKTIIDFPRL